MVKDLFIFANQKKIYYKNYQLAEKRRVQFDIPVSLESADNVITLISRDNEGVRARKNVIIRSMKSN